MGNPTEFTSKAELNAFYEKHARTMFDLAPALCPRVPVPWNELTEDVRFEMFLTQHPDRDPDDFLEMKIIDGLHEGEWFPCELIEHIPAKPPQGEVFTVEIAENAKLWVGMQFAGVSRENLRPAALENNRRGTDRSSVGGQFKLPSETNTDDPSSPGQGPGNAVLEFQPLTEEDARIQFDRMLTVLEATRLRTGKRSFHGEDLKEFENTFIFKAQATSLESWKHVSLKAIVRGIDRGIECMLFVVWATDGTYSKHVPRSRLQVRLR